MMPPTSQIGLVALCVWSSATRFDSCGAEAALACGIDGGDVGPTSGFFFSAVDIVVGRFGVGKRKTKTTKYTKYRKLSSI